MRDAVQRALRGTSSWTVLALHLSRLAPPAPRPHHRRIARAVLEDAASRQQGQLFTLANGDLVLLFPPTDSGIGLTATLGNLFAADSPDPGLLLSRWPLPDQLGALSAFLDAVPTIDAAPNTIERDSGLAAVTTLVNAVEPRRIRDLLQRQTGVLLTIGGAERLIPIFREVRFSLPALEARVALTGHVTADPFLFRHLIAKLDGTVLTATTDDLDHDRPMVAGIRNGRMALHVNMSLEAVRSPAFGRFVDAVKRAGARCVVEIAVIEAFADMEAFMTVRAQLAAVGFGLALDEVTHHALLLTKLDHLGADWLKLDWSRQFLQCGDTLDDALQAVDPARIILKADTEEAVRWGMAHGIRRFQGRHTDAILAAGRLATCPAAHRCTLRLCIERESGASSGSRQGCENLPLLDAGVATERVT